VFSFGGFSVKLAFRLLCAAAVVAFFWLSFNPAKAQTQTLPTNPDSFITQLTSSASDSFAGDMSGNGRFVVIESTGDIATDNPRNSDHNREIFLADYAQRRIFQITATKSTLKPGASPTPTPTPSPTASPTPTPSPANEDPNTIQYQVSNNKPVISNDGKWIVFTSNAGNPADFDGNIAANSAALAADGNQEIWAYRIPDVTNVDLSTGANLLVQNLSTGTFFQITNTAASRLPQPGTSTVAPFVAFDNRNPAVNDDGSIISFVSNRNLINGNPSPPPSESQTPQVFIANRTNGLTFLQVTNIPATVKTNISGFVENPSLSGDGTVLAFLSNANIPGPGGTANNADVNAEVYLARYNGNTVTSITQVTKTTADNGASVNVWSPGRRMSRNGNFLAFESRADLSGNGALQTNLTTFLYDIGANTFRQIGPRATSGSDVLRFPTFTGDNSTLVFISSLNFKADGTAPSTATDGLNPNSRVQIFATPVTANAFSVLTNTPASAGVPNIQAYTSNTIRRIAFSAGSVDFGGGNSDLFTETFYMVVPPNAGETPASANALSYFTGASNIPVVAASPAPTPPAVTGLAPGMLGIIRPAPSPAPAVTLAPSVSDACGGGNPSSDCASEALRRPPLPIELNGVSVSVGSSAAGLYFVSPGQINFVVPRGVTPATSIPVVINNNGAVIRSTLTILAAQPDIFTSTNDAGGRARAFNATNPKLMPLPTEPFSVTSTDANGNTVPTILGIVVTGVRNAQTSQVTVRIGTTDISGTSINFVGPTDTPGIDQINVTLPASLAGAGDVPVIVTVNSGTAVTSRPADTAPHITIQ